MWTREKAEQVAREQKAELEAQGRFDVVMVPKFLPEVGDWVVEGVFKVDLEKDPIWGPIARELGLMEGEDDTG